MELLLWTSTQLIMCLQRGNREVTYSSCNFVTEENIIITALECRTHHIVHNKNVMIVAVSWRYTLCKMARYPRHTHVWFLSIVSCANRIIKQRNLLPRKLFWYSVYKELWVCGIMISVCLCKETMLYWTASYSNSAPNIIKRSRHGNLNGWNM